MDDKTLEALKGSIAKWGAIVAGKGEDLMAQNCPLCQAFPGCYGCPVAEKTDTADCQDTPWEDWFCDFQNHETKMANTPGRVRLAQAELDFLRSLLPDEESV